ncbi:alpha-ribazole phosphatase family protein [Rhodovulum euryhalinum]|uniref:Alpha-ribazole phosphatase n=1 Tax=Rhodovulum euryhalinum TaxID=35805 RepID=A0A4R2KUV3_9RHOB|nr:alpha-ribazole phosphatase family protein [Rhodovulum euryhalinum]TCO73968.1 alpha-ribazole phosphatase [Rhodovulum euryhalinum]
MGLILVRHTAPDVAPGTCYGRLDLPPGPGFADEAAAVLDAMPPVTRVLTSPLIRCRALAEHIGAARGLPVEVEPRLIEIDFGAWEGLAWDAVPRDELDAWAADFWNARPHGGESVAMFTARVADWLAGQGGAAGWLAVTHAGLMRAAQHLLGRDESWACRFSHGQTLALSAGDLSALAARPMP